MVDMLIMVDKNFSSATHLERDLRHPVILSLRHGSLVVPELKPRHRPEQIKLCLADIYT